MRLYELPSCSMPFTISAAVLASVPLRRHTAALGVVREAVIVPTPEDPELIPVLLGRAAGEFMTKHLEANRVRGIGVGWGATLREAIRHVKPGQWPELNVNSMMGGLTRGLEINTFETASGLAARAPAELDSNRRMYLAARRCPVKAGRWSGRLVGSSDQVQPSVVRAHEWQEPGRPEMAGNGRPLQAA